MDRGLPYTTCYALRAMHYVLCTTCYALRASQPIKNIFLKKEKKKKSKISKIYTKFWF